MEAGSWRPFRGNDKINGGLKMSLQEDREGKEGSGRLAGRGSSLCKGLESRQAQGIHGRWA